jgi:hypothetical protein
MQKKMGRPRLSKKGALAVVFSVRLRPDEARRVREAIKQSGESQPVWLRTALLRSAGEAG